MSISITSLSLVQPANPSSISPGKRYCHMLVREGVDDVLRKLVSLPDSNASVRELAGRVVDVLQENGFTKDL